MSNPIRDIMLEATPDPYTAEVLVGFLKSEGIPAYVKGGELEDPVASAERAMHTLGCQVFVPEDRIVQARRIIEEGKRSGRMVPPEDFPRSQER
jgi:hypothetical protein